MPCAKKYDCAIEYTSDYRFYCNVYLDTNTLNTLQQHDSTELYGIRVLPMDDFNLMKSLQVICCANNSWYHKESFKEMAFSMNDDFSCPNCEEKDDFQYDILANGIFVPDTDRSPKQKQLPSLKPKNVGPIIMKINQVPLFESTIDAT